MSKIKPGQVGDFNGKIGQVVISKWRNLTVGRATPKKSTKTPTAGQLNQRSAFKLVMKFLKQLKVAVNAGYTKSGNLSPMNVAVQYHLGNAITGVAPNFAIDYTKVVLSKGELFGVYEAAVTGVAGSTMHINWTIDAIEVEGTTDDDAVFIVFYSPATGYSLTNAHVAKRSALTADVKMPRVFTGNSVHVWLFLVAADGKSVSNAEYLGLKAVLA